MSRLLIWKTRNFKRDERGLQFVELAIVLPVLAVLFAAAAEFGRYFYQYATLSKGTRVAVRYLATARTNGVDDVGAKNLVVYGNFAGTGSPIVNGLTTAKIQVTRRNAAGTVMTGGVPKTVTIQIIDLPSTPLFNLGGLAGSSASLAINISPSVTMRYLLTQPPI